MELGFKGSICITLAVAGLAFTSNAVAGHATNFLDALQSEVTNRVANPGTNTSRPQQRALSNAARSLNRNTTTLPADLGVLATAAAQLNAQHQDDATMAGLEAQAIADYSAEAHAQLDGVYLRIGTNDVSRRLSNQVVKANAALDRADATTNSIPTHARALALAFNKIAPAERKVRSLFPAPIVLPPVVVTNPPIILPPAVTPGTPGLAPDSVGTRYVTLYENAIVNDQTIFYFSTAQTGAQIYSVHNPEELGLWNYVRTGADAAVIVVAPNYPANASQRPLNLTFTNTTTGTFTGKTYYGDAVEGTFRLD